MISGASPKVITAASRAQEILDAARRVLGDPVNRRRYDEAAGFQRDGEGLAGPRRYPSDPGWGPSDFSLAGGMSVQSVLGGLMAATEWLAPHPRPPRRVPVPDLRGL